MGLKDGGSAFRAHCQACCPCHTGGEVGYEGITIRDYFAAQAITAAYDCMTKIAAKRRGPIEDGEAEKAIAKLTYDIADAMIAHREAAPTVEPKKE